MKTCIGLRLVTDSGTKCAWVIHESKAIQIHVYNNRRCLRVPRVSGSVKNPHNNNNMYTSFTMSIQILQNLGGSINYFREYLFFVNTYSN